VIRTTHLGITPPGAEAPVIVDAAFEIPEGDLCLVVGATGTGKSTLLGMLARTIQPLVNVFISCLIGSALAAAIGVRELTSVTQQLNLHYAEAVVTFLLSGLIYLALALGATRLGAMLERRAAGGREARA